MLPRGVVLEVEVRGGRRGRGRRPRTRRGRRERLYTTSADLLRRRRCSAPASEGAICWRRPSATSTACTRRATSSCARVLDDGQAALASARPGARFAYVFHGSSGSSPDDVRTAIAAGVVKVNLDTDAQYAFTRAIAGHVLANYDGVLPRSTAASATRGLRPALLGRQGGGGARFARRRRGQALRLGGSEPAAQLTTPRDGTAAAADLDTHDTMR